MHESLLLIASGIFLVIDSGWLLFFAWKSSINCFWNILAWTPETAEMPDTAEIPETPETPEIDETAETT